VALGKNWWRFVASTEMDLHSSEGPATGHLDTGFFLGFPVSISKR